MRNYAYIIAIVATIVFLIWLDKAVFDGIANSGMPSYLKWILLSK